MLRPAMNYKQPPTLLLCCVAILFSTGCKPADRDKTLSEAEYIKRGVPDIGNKWTPSHCVEAAKALAAIGKANARHLPRPQSDKSGGVFSKIHDLCIERVTVPKNVRLQMRNLVHTLEMGRLLIHAYGTAVIEDRKYAPELMELWGSFLLMWAKGIPVSIAFLKTIPADDPSYQKRMDGLAQILSGVTVSVHTALLLIADRSHPRIARARLAFRLEEALPVLLRGVDKDRKGLVQAVTDVAEQSGDSDIRASLYRALKAANAKTPTKH